MDYKPTGKASYKARDKKICALLNDPEVSDADKDELVAKGIAEVQSTWSRAEKRSRCSWAISKPVEIPLCHDEQFPTLGKRKFIVRDGRE